MPTCVRSSPSPISTGSSACPTPRTGSTTTRPSASTSCSPTSSAQPSRPTTADRTVMSTPFGPVKQIDAGLLNVGYVDAGPDDGPPVLLLHGWPYDIHSYGGVVPRLAATGYRVVVPYLRGFGTTR